VSIELSVPQSNKTKECFAKKTKLFADFEEKSMLKKGGFLWLRTQSTVKSSYEHKTEAKKDCSS
jgi:hypothetical protein